MKGIINKALIKSSSYVNGSWLPDTDTFDVINPATQRLIATVNNANADDANDAILSAERAFSTWKKQTANQRAEYLLKWASLITENEKDLAHLLTLEQGKTLDEALAEIRYGVSYLTWFSEEGKRIYGDTIPAASSQQRIIVTKQAVGVVTAITPWNFPNAMILRKASAALAAGCTFVIKPAAETPLSALALAQLADTAGIPKGVFNVLASTDAPSIGNVLTQHNVVRKFSFTGSTAVGKILLAQCASGVKKVSMELGGNAPFIVFKSADIEDAVQGLVVNKIRNAGQTCVSANRIFVQQSILTEFNNKLIQQLKKIQVGNGLDTDTTIGPLISSKATTKISQLVQRAVKQGATIAFQSKPTSATNKSNCFFPVTLLSHVTNNMAIAQSEIFGPVVSIISFENESDVIEQANNTQAGLAAYFYSQDFKQIWRVSESLDFGMVGINETAISNAAAPFGGIKESGNGREGSHYGLDDYLTLKYTCIGGIN